MTKQGYAVAAVVVTYASRLSFLTQTADAILRDEHVKKLILVDNASSAYEGILELAKQYPGRVEVVRHENNVGSAGGFAAGLRRAMEEDVDYVYLSDDDIVVSDSFVEKFASAHRVIGNDQAVLLARRASFWAGTDVHYRLEGEVPPRKYFNIISPKIMGVFLKSLIGLKDKHTDRNPARFFPIIPAHGWAYAGALLPIAAVRTSPLPDETLGLYLDDIVYSWGVLDAGFKSFALMEPHLEDLEMTHSGSHTATGLFSPSVSTTKIYYETRNRVRVSLAYGNANRALLCMQVCVWFVAVSMLGIVRTGFTKEALDRMKLIYVALRAGFNPKHPIPETVSVRV